MAVPGTSRQTATADRVATALVNLTKPRRSCCARAELPSPDGSGYAQRPEAHLLSSDERFHCLTIVLYFRVRPAVV
jgi:hypothetical protein